MAVDVQVGIDLGQIDTRDLIDELKYRPGLEKAELMVMDAYEIIEHLEVIGCPQDILTQLRRWELLPIVNDDTLEKWLRFCEAA